MEALKLCVGERLRLADAIIEIERIGKDCYPECEALRRAGSCDLARESVFARVLESGDVRVGQAVELIAKVTDFQSFACVSVEKG